MILNAWYSEHSILELHQELQKLRVSHYILNYSNGKPQFQAKPYGFSQPANVYLISKLQDFKKIPKTAPTIVFASISEHEFLTSNLAVMPQLSRSRNLEEVLKYCLVNSKGGFELYINEPSLMDYVNIASKPSILNQLQSSWYKITPYSDRKIAQHCVVDYLYGKLSLRKATSILDKTSKMQTLIPILKSAPSTNLRAAVALSLKNGGVAEIAESYGLDPFDINYIIASAKS